jgi:hypothetical protein
VVGVELDLRVLLPLAGLAAAGAQVFLGEQEHLDRGTAEETVMTHRKELTMAAVAVARVGLV